MFSIIFLISDAEDSKIGLNLINLRPQKSFLMIVIVFIW